MSFAFFTSGARRFQTKRFVPARAGTAESLGAYVALSVEPVQALESALPVKLRIVPPALSRKASDTSPFDFSASQYVTAAPGGGFSPTAGMGRSLRPPAKRTACSGANRCTRSASAAVV